MQCRLVLDDFRDLSAAIARCRRLLDLDADPVAVVDAKSQDPHLGAGGQGPGQRIPRTVDEAGTGGTGWSRGQQVSLKAARPRWASGAGLRASRLTDFYGWSDPCISVHRAADIAGS